MKKRILVYGTQNCNLFICFVNHEFVGFIRIIITFDFVRFMTLSCIRNCWFFPSCRAQPCTVTYQSFVDRTIVFMDVSWTFCL